ncbi:MAG TPA: prolyl oligopeptidase family serine peptidase, partial [Blastocatellia bacterium]|nr:prolyl oligopeptidase family serine peptidase [Blastocatellia bacterium]
MKTGFRRISLPVILSLIVSLALPSALLAADKRAISETDLFKFVWIADPQISPDGSRVVFVRVWVNQKSDRYETALWIVPTSGGPSRQLTAGPRDAGPRWSPDGKMLAFIRSAEKEGKPQPPQIYLLSLEGGEAQQLTDSPRSPGGFEWSPDGKTIAFASREEPNKDAPNPEEGAKDRVSDVRVITKAVYRFNGAGYFNPRSHSHIWTISVASTAPGEKPKARQVTKGNFDEGNMSWSQDGSRIYFSTNRAAEPYYSEPRSDLYSIDREGGDERQVLSFAGGMGGYSFSDAGKRIAFTGVQNHKPVRSYGQPDLFVMNDESGAKPQNLTASYDFDIGGGLAGDQRAPRGGSPGGVTWSKDGRWLLVNVAEHGASNLKRIDAATGKVEPLTTGAQEVMSYTATADASRLAMVVSTSTNVGDIYLLETASGQMTRLTKINDELFSGLNLTDPEEIWYTSFDGKKVQAWIQKPPGFESSKKYPLILQIHGGPHAAYGFTFTHEFQWMAAKGYVVLYTNPRGSTSYGQDFGNVIQYNYPG